MSKPKIAASSYLNSAPLCYSFVKGQQRDSCRFFSDRAPSRCADMLRAGEVSAALIPVIEYQRIADLLIAPNVAVASKKSVRSVVLASRVPIEEATSIALDTCSRTSTVLIKIILSRFYNRAPRYTPSAPDISQMLESNDAALIIGDPAIKIDRSALYVYDMADEWRKHTGLPFVFAFWAVRADARLKPDQVDFEAAKREGIEHLNEIAAEYAANLGEPEDSLLDYLTNNINLELDRENLEGLSLYYRLALECGLIGEIKDIRFWR